MSYTYETEEYKGMIIKIEIDEFPDDPRSWDNLGTMQCFHNKYSLGDKHIVDSRDFNGWDDMESYLIENHDAVVILPIYMYDHSNITLSTESFIGRAQHAEWDSGRLGLIFVTREKLLKEYNVKRLSKKIIEMATNVLKSEVEIYNMYVSGDVYDLVVYDENDEVIHSCGGFYGTDNIEAMIEEGKSYIDSELEEREKLAPMKERESMEAEGQLSLELNL